LVIGALQTVTAPGATVSWVAGDGDWGTPGNWNTGAVPGMSDDVVIDRPAPTTVTHSGGVDVVNSLVCQNAFVLSGGLLIPSVTIQVNNGFGIYGGGRLANTTLLKATNGQPVSVTGSGTLDNVSLASDVTVADGAQLTIGNSLTLVSGASITLNSSFTQTGLLLVHGTQTISGDGQIVLAGTTFNNDVILGDNNGPTALTLGPGVTVRGGGRIDQNNSSTLLNEGTIQADAFSQTLMVAPALTNTGTLRVTNGAVLDLTGTWTNSGAIQVDNATLDLDGNFAGLSATTGFSRNGGTVNVGGILTGGLALDGTTGSWNVDGGLVIGGTFSVSAGAQLSLTNRGRLANLTALKPTNDEPILITGLGTMDNVSLASDVIVGDGAQLTIGNSLTLVSGASITLNSSFNQTDLLLVHGTQTIGGAGQIVLAGTTFNNDLILGDDHGPTALTLGPGVTVRGGGRIDQNNLSTLLNQGTMQADASGQALVVTPALTNTGTLQALSGGILSIVGPYTPEGGTVIVGLNSAANYGHIQFTTPLPEGGIFTVALLDQFRPIPGDSFHVLTYPSFTGTFPCFGGLDLGSGILLQPHIGSTALKLVATAYPTNSAAPTLSISTAPGAVSLTWPSGYTDWELLSSTNFASPAWRPVSAPCGNQVLVPVSGTDQQYFRLGRTN
jgi:hypothetical protein